MRIPEREASCLLVINGRALENGRVIWLAWSRGLNIDVPPTGWNQEHTIIYSDLQHLFVCVCLILHHFSTLIRLQKWISRLSVHLTSVLWCTICLGRYSHYLHTIATEIIRIVTVIMLYRYIWRYNFTLDFHTISQKT